jgi:hypothetical protein
MDFFAEKKDTIFHAGFNMPLVSQLSLKLELEVVAASCEEPATTSELRLELALVVGLAEFDPRLLTLGPES